MNRNEFLKVGVFMAGAKLFSGLLSEPEPEKHEVFIPIVQGGCNQDFVKLAEYTVPSPAGFASGFVFAEFGKYRKFIIECTSKVYSEISWMPAIRINENDDNVYNQYADILFSEKKIAENTVCDRIALPATVYLDQESVPYWFRFEIDNTTGFYHPYSVRGIMPISNHGLAQFGISGIFGCEDEIVRFDLFSNYPTGLFRCNTAVSLYGIK